MKRFVPITLVLMGAAVEFHAHNVGNAVTWNREISRIFYERCASCHRDGGTSFSLINYSEVQPRAAAIKNAVLLRQMPPWGAVKGFGDFRNDQGLSQQELDLITDWVDSDTPKGNNPKVLPKVPKFSKAAAFEPPKGSMAVRAGETLRQPFVVDGVFPEAAPPGVSLQITAVLPDGEIEPLVWLYEYRESYKHPFLFRKPVALPAGTEIRGLPADARLFLIPGKQKAEPGKKEFAFQGTVETVDASSKTMSVRGERIKGWMESMTMNYTADRAEVFDRIKPGDRITAKVYDGDYKVLHAVRIESPHR